MPCAGYVAVAIPLAFIAVMIGVIGVLEFLRRKRTEDKNDDWGG
jgi:hypothetical protein